jgi:uncharacterized membrane protein YphA (DoxX/SURF4 family)
MNRTLILWALSLYIAVVFVQSLFFKFAGADESVFIFQTIEDWIGLSFFEPFLRNFIGAAELLCSALLLMPATRPLGAAGALTVITGAIVFHLFSPLGVVVKDDGGTLFILACGVFVASAAILWMERRALPGLPRRMGFAL